MTPSPANPGARTTLGRIAGQSLVAVALAALPLGCGGGGGGGGSVTPPATVAVNVINMLLSDPDGVADQDCGDAGAPNPDSIVSVTYTPVTPPGAPVTVTFSTPIAPAQFASVPGGIAPGTYTFQANYGGGAPHEADQCPADDVVLVLGSPTGVQFQH